jgi:multisubunit Na+/H+ antiporter MnhG subunit
MSSQEGFFLASKVINKKISLEEGLMSAFSRGIMSSFADSLNAFAGARIVSRYQCEDMVNTRTFLSIDDLLEKAGKKKPDEDSPEGEVDIPSLDAEEIPQDEENQSESDADAADDISGEDSEQSLTVEDTEATLSDDELAVTQNQVSSEEQPDGEQAGDIAKAIEGIPLTNIDIILKPILEEIEVLKSNRDDILAFIKRLEWYSDIANKDSSIPAGLISIAVIILVFGISAFLFLQENIIAALFILLPGIFAGVFSYIMEVKAAKSREEEAEKQRKAKKKEEDNYRSRLEEIDGLLTEKAEYVESIRAKILNG